MAASSASCRQRKRRPRSQLQERRSEQKNSKSQASTSSGITTFKFQMPRAHRPSWGLVFEISLEFGTWSLELSLSDHLGPRRKQLLPHGSQILSTGHLPEFRQIPPAFRGPSHLLRR